MALSKIEPVKQFKDDDLITCGICHIEIQHPRSLLCLHTYCLGCLREWSKNRKDVVICPLCREPTPLPPNGVDGLRSNFFVTKLKDRKAVSRQLMDKDVKIVCTSCDVSDGNEAVARCLECDDFLCDPCFKAHKSMRLMKHHSVFTLKEMRSGKVGLSQRKFKEDQCKEHPGQVFWFFCQTCSIPICRDCTVVEHPTGSHKVVKLSDAVTGQREEIQGLVGRCRAVKLKVDGALEKTSNLHKDLEVNCNKVTLAVNETRERVEKSLLKILDKNQEELKKNIAGLKLMREKKLLEYEDELQMLQSRLSTALEMATQISNEGSDCDVVSIHTQLVTTLRQLGQISTPSINLGSINFVEDSSLPRSVSSIGKVVEDGMKYTPHSDSRRKYNKDQWNARWKMVKKFGDSGSGQLEDARGVAINQDGDVAVADYGAARVYVYNTDDGKMKLAIDTTKSLHSNSSEYKSYPHGLAVSQDGNYIITDRTYFPTIYDSKGNYVRQIPIEKHKDKYTYGLAVNSQDHILVGSSTVSHLSTHNYSDGALISSVDIRFGAHYISVSSDDSKIIISAGGTPGVQVINSKGHTIHKLCKPADASVWYPSGVCTIGEGEEEEVFVCNRGESSGIYRFSLNTGKYLSCVTSDVIDPRGIAFTEDGELVVAERNCVKVFVPSS